MSDTSLKQFAHTSIDWRLAIDRSRFVFEPGSRAVRVHNGTDSIVELLGVSAY